VSLHDLKKTKKRVPQKNSNIDRGQKVKKKGIHYADGIRISPPPPKVTMKGGREKCRGGKGSILQNNTVMMKKTKEYPQPVCQILKGKEESGKNGGLRTIASGS